MRAAFSNSVSAELLSGLLDHGGHSQLRQPLQGVRIAAVKVQCRAARDEFVHRRVGFFCVEDPRNVVSEWLHGAERRLGVVGDGKAKIRCAAASCWRAFSVWTG